MVTHPLTDHPAEAESNRPRLREVLPALVSVLLLFGLLMGGAFALREVADLGLWLVETR
jgi:hypothetical protein